MCCARGVPEQLAAHSGALSSKHFSPPPLQATVTVLVMDTANVYLYFKDQPTSDSESALTAAVAWP